MCEKRGFLPPLCWQSTVPSCRVESLIFPTRSTGKLRVNLPEVSLLSHSKIHEPKAFANHRSIFSFLTWWFSCWGSQKGGAAPWLRGCALSVGGKDVNTRATASHRGQGESSVKWKLVFGAHRLTRWSWGAGGKPLLGWRFQSAIISSPKGTEPKICHCATFGGTCHVLESFQMQEILCLLL